MITILFLLGMIAIGFMVSMGYLWYIQNDVQGQTNKNKTSSQKTIWELTENMDAGQPLTDDMITSRMVPIDLMEGLTLEKESIIGKSLKLNSKKGSILTENLLYEGEPLSDDLRIHNYNFVVLTEHLVSGDYIDIRISFADGSDYIVLSKKKILEISLYNQEEQQNDSLWLQMTEEEILRMSSAVVDSYLNEGCNIYAIEYVAETQNGAIVNYPVNQVVEQLIESDPNIVTRAENVVAMRNRKQLEQDMQSYKEEEESSVNSINKKQETSEYDRNQEKLNHAIDSTPDEAWREEVEYID